mmetsp:Transcript_10346/g.31791  ORF Transcript_10346/g.31791 Transcript_10346/m.31791 type:complete len:218 (-) Transcript_10346:907-1560(-)
MPRRHSSPLGAARMVLCMADQLPFQLATRHEGYVTAELCYCSSLDCTHSQDRFWESKMWAPRICSATSGCMELAPITSSLQQHCYRNSTSCPLPRGPLPESRTLLLNILTRTSRAKCLLSCLLHLVHFCAGQVTVAGNSTRQWAESSRRRCCLNQVPPLYGTLFQCLSCVVSSRKQCRLASSFNWNTPYSILVAHELIRTRCGAHQLKGGVSRLSSS